MSDDYYGSAFGWAMAGSSKGVIVELTDDDYDRHCGHYPIGELTNEGYTVVGYKNGCVVTSRDSCFMGKKYSALKVLIPKSYDYPYGKLLAVGTIYEDDGTYYVPDGLLNYNGVESWVAPNEAIVQINEWCKQYGKGGPLRKKVYE